MATDFDTRASTWDDDPARVQRAEAIAAAIRTAVPGGSTVRLLEYGAGTGLVSQALADHVGAITLAEPSAGMREVIDRKVAEGTLPPRTRVWDLDLTTADLPEDRFDLIVTVLTLHHILDLPPVLTGFAQLLDDGGHLCIADLEAEDGNFHGDDSDFDGHHGFDRGDLTRMLEDAGFTDVRFEPCYEVEKDTGSYPVFLATCRR